MSDETLQSRIADLERQVIELQKTSKSDIDRRAEQLGMRCANCKYGKSMPVDIGSLVECTLMSNTECIHMESNYHHYCHSWWPK